MSLPTSMGPAESAPAKTIDERFHPLALAISSALVLWMAFPPVDRGYLAWFALVPMLFLISSRRSSRSIYVSAWIGGFLFGLLSLFWISQTSGPGMVLMALFLSVSWPLFLLVCRLGTMRLRLPSLLIAPIVWLAFEYARSLLLSGFPWYYLAHTQYRYLPMIQVSDLAGAWGLSFVIAFVNACWADGIGRAVDPSDQWNARSTLLRIGFPFVLIGLVAIYGSIQLASSRFTPGPTVALLQTDFRQELGNGPKLDTVFAAIDRLMSQAMKASPAPDLIVWPETSYPIGSVRIDPTLTETEFAALAHKIDPESTTADWRDRGVRGRADMESLTRASGIPMVVGTATYDFSKRKIDRFNSAILFRPNSQKTESYYKQSLVPFGEYVPFVQAMPWLLALTPYPDGYVPSLTPGSGPLTFEAKKYRFAPIICFEDTVPGLVRGFFRRSREKTPDVLVNLTNDGWFRGTSEHQVHLAISVFRAVECRAPLVRAVNTGISAVIDGNGEIQAMLPASTSSVLIKQVPLDPRSSLYILGGDWLPIACLVMTVGCVVLSLAWNRQSSTLAHPASVG